MFASRTTHRALITARHTQRLTALRARNFHLFFQDFNFLFFCFDLFFLFKM
jgi:hypothetical protein